MTYFLFCLVGQYVFAPGTAVRVRAYQVLAPIAVLAYPHPHPSVYSLIQSLNLRSTAYQCPLSLSVSVSLFQFLRQYINHKRDPVLLCYLLNSCIGYAFTVHFPFLPFRFGFSKTSILLLYHDSFYVFL